MPFNSKAKAREWRERTREDRRAYNRDYYSQHRNDILRKRAEQRLGDVESAREESRKRRARKREEYRKTKRDWYERNRERVLAQTKEWRYRNREKLRLLWAQYRNRHRVERNERQAIYAKTTEGRESSRRYERKISQMEIPQLLDQIKRGEPEKWQITIARELLRKIKRKSRQTREQ